MQQILAFSQSIGQQAYNLLIEHRLRISGPRIVRIVPSVMLVCSVGQSYNADKTGLWIVVAAVSGGLVSSGVQVSLLAPKMIIAARAMNY